MNKTILVETQENRQTRLVLNKIVSLTKRVILQIGGGGGPYNCTVHLEGGVQHKIKPSEYDLISKALDDNKIHSLEVSHISSGKVIVITDKIVEIKLAQAVDNVPGVAGEHNQIVLSNGQTVALKPREGLLDIFENILQEAHQQSEAVQSTSTESETTNE